MSINDQTNPVVINENLPTICTLCSDGVSKPTNTNCPKYYVCLEQYGDVQLCIESNP